MHCRPHTTLEIMFQLEKRFNMFSKNKYQVNRQHEL